MRVVKLASWIDNRYASPTSLIILSKDLSLWHVGYTRLSFI